MEKLIEQIKEEYQKKLNNQYRRLNKNNSMIDLLTEEEISLLNPLTDELFVAMIAAEKIEIINEKLSVEKEIAEDEKLLDNPRIRSDEKSELRKDIINAKNTLKRLDERYLILSQVYDFLKKDENRESTTSSR